MEKKKRKQHTIKQNVINMFPTLAGIPLDCSGTRSEELWRPAVTIASSLCGLHVSYIFIFDLAKIKASDVRHGRKEGRHLKDFRASCRRFFGSHDLELEGNFKRLADTWLSFTAAKSSEGKVDDEDLDFCIEP